MSYRHGVKTIVYFCHIFPSAPLLTVEINTSGTLLLNFVSLLTLKRRKMCIKWLLSYNLMKMIIVFLLNLTDYSLNSTLTYL